MPSAVVMLTTFDSYEHIYASKHHRRCFFALPEIATTCSQRRAARRNVFVLAENCCDPSQMGVWQNLDNRLRAQAANDDLSGAVLLTRAGHTIFEGSYGLADRAADIPITPATVRSRLGDQDVHRSRDRRPGHFGPLTFETPVVDVLPPERRPSTLQPETSPCPPALPHLRDRRLLRGGRRLPCLPGRLRLLVAAAARLLAWSGRPTSCRSSRTCRRTATRARSGSTATPATSCSGWSSRS